MPNSYFQYDPGTEHLPSDAFRISPSQMSKFLDKRHEWWAEQVCGEKGFIGSTATELGNCIHASMAMYFDTQTVDKQAVEDYIDSIQNDDVDKDVIRSQWKTMVTNLINDYYATHLGTASEIFVTAKVKDHVYAAGSIDAYDEHTGTITDFKSMGSLDSARVPTKFPRAYYFQQMIYAWILIQNGKPVNYLKLAYVTRENIGRVSEKTGKPLKDYDSEVHVITHQITPEDLDLIESVLGLMADTMVLHKTNPEFEHILAQDPRRKASNPTPSILFKD